MSLVDTLLKKLVPNVATDAPKTKSQLELSISRKQEPDRNHHLGGRSFYFFDFDDNIAFLATPVVLFHKDTGEEIMLTSGEFAQISRDLKENGHFYDHILDFDDKNGSFRFYRDSDQSLWTKAFRKKQAFEKDILDILNQADLMWKGPSWNCFYHAVFNQRPTSIITARGHSPETIKKGIRLIHKNGHLPKEPNYLDIFPVNHPETKTRLGHELDDTDVAVMKQKAIRMSVEKAFEDYGYNPHHRFGMSDDDPRNVELITQEFRALKKDYPDVSFFVISTSHGDFVKKEVFTDYSVDQNLYPRHQLSLF